MIRNLKIKFVLVNMALITIVLAIIFGAVYASTQNRLAKESLEILERAVREENRINPPPEGDKVPIRDPDFMPIPTFTVNIDQEGKIVSAKGALFDLSDQATLEQIVQTVLDGDGNSGIITTANLRYLQQDTNYGSRISFVDRSMEISTLAGLIKISLLVGLGSLLGFLLISLYLANWALRPVARAWDQQKQFIADASHELKTPLTVILANAGIVLSHPDDTVQMQSKWIEHIQAEATRMSSLVESLLFLAGSDDMQAQTKMSRINLSDILWEVVLPFEPVIFEQNKNLQTFIESNLFITGDEGRLKQLLGILLDNACKYADERGLITVRLASNKEQTVQLTVSNTGGYIPADNLANIFERFYRVDKARVRQQGGYGLGLAIARSIVEMHKARISVTSTPESGTEFAVKFMAETQSPKPQV